MADRDKRLARKRSTLREMSGAAFKRAADLRRQNAIRAGLGLAGYPRRDDAAEADIFEDVCDFLEAVRSLDERTKEAIRKQIAKRRSEEKKAL